MPTNNGPQRNGQPTWPVYLTATLIVAGILLIANIPFTIAVIGVIISEPSIVYSAFWLGIFGIPTIALDIWLIRWLKDNLQVLHWTNQSIHHPTKGDCAS